MQPIPQTAPISNFRKYQEGILAMMDRAPVVLMNRATPRAVLVNPETWNATAERLAYLESIIAGDAASARIASGDYHTVEDFEAAMSS